MPAGPPFLSFPQVVSGNPRSFLLPRRQTCGVPPPQHGRPLAPDPYLWIPAFAGMTVMCDAGSAPRPPQPLPSLPPVPSVMPAGPPFLSFPQVVSGNPRSFLLPRRQTCGVPPPQHGRPLAPDPYLWIPAFAGMTVMCDAGSAPRPTQSPPSLPPAPSVTPSGPPLCPSRRSPLCHSRRL